MPAALPVPISDAHTGDLSTGDSAVATSVSWDGLCFYEARGLIRARRRGNGHHAYLPEIVELVQYVRTAQQLDFTLARIEEGMLHVWQQPNTDIAATALLRDKSTMIDARIVSLQVMRNTLVTRVGMACSPAPA